jgi:integrase
MLSTYIDEWLAESSEQSPKTKHRNRRNLEQWVLPYMDKPLLTITTEDCHRLFKVRLPEVGATKSSIHNAFATLRNLMNHARMMDKLPQTHDPLARVKVSKPPSKVKPDDEKYVGKRVNVTLGMLRWLEDPSNPHHHLYTRTLLMFSGLRRAELLGLEWSCIHHLEKRGKAYIEVKQQLAGPETKKPWHIHPRTKTGNVRRTDLSETMRKALLAHRELELHADADWAKDLVFVTQTKRGTRNVTFNEYSADWNTVLKGYMTKNGREFQESDYYRPHYARHVAVHLLVRGGTTLIVAQRMVGHGDVKMTEHYYQTSTNETRAGAAGLDAFMGLGKH